MAGPAAALTLDVLLHEADVARRAADRRRRPVGRVPQLELDLCGRREKDGHVAMLRDLAQRTRYNPSGVCSNFK